MIRYIDIYVKIYYRKNRKCTMIRIKEIILYSPHVVSLVLIIYICIYMFMYRFIHIYLHLLQQFHNSIVLFIVGPLVANKVLSEAIRHTKRKFVRDSFKLIIPDLSTAIDDIYTPLDIVTECQSKQPKR